MVFKKECKYRDFISTAVMKYCRKTKPQKFCKFRRISTTKEGACICLVGIEAAAGTLVAPKN